MAEEPITIGRSRVQAPALYMTMDQQRRKQMVSDLLHWPCAGIIPDVAISALSVWLLKQQGIL